MGELLVHGHAEGRLPPTHAVLDVVVRVRDVESQRAAMQLAAERCRTVDHALDEARRDIQPLVRAAETSSIRTGEEFEYAPDGRRRPGGWVVERGTRVECAPDADGLTSLVQALAGDGITLSGPRWHVAPGAEQWDMLRTAAVADALRRARAYASGVEGKVGAVRWVAEPGLRLRADPVNVYPVAPVRRMAVATERDEDDEHPPMRVSVESVAVEVTVEAAFDLG